MSVRFTIPGEPVPLQRARTGRGHHYLPAQSRAYRELVRTAWMQAGRPSLGDALFTASMRFVGAHGNADLSNMIKAVEDALNGLAFTDDRQVVCFSGCHKLPVDADGPRAEVELWPATTVAP